MNFGSLWGRAATKPALLFPMHCGHDRFVKGNPSHLHTKCLTSSSKCLTSSSKCLTSSNRCLTSSNKKLVVTSALHQRITCCKHHFIVLWWMIGPTFAVSNMSILSCSVFFCVLACSAGGVPDPFVVLLLLSFPGMGIVFGAFPFFFLIPVEP